MKYKIKKQIGGQRKYRSWSQWSEDDYVIVKIISEYEDTYGHTGWEAEVLEQSFEKPEYELKDGEKDVIREGDIIGLNHTGSLAYKMTALGKELGQIKRDINGEPEMSKEGLPLYVIPRGTLLMVKYLGQEKLIRGRFKGTLAHSVEISLVEKEEPQKGPSI